MLSPECPRIQGLDLAGPGACITCSMHPRPANTLQRYACTHVIVWAVSALNKHPSREGLPSSVHSAPQLWCCGCYPTLAPGTRSCTLPHPAVRCTCRLSTQAAMHYSAPCDASTACKCSVHSGKQQQLWNTMSRTCTHLTHYLKPAPLDLNLLRQVQALTKPLPTRCCQPWPAGCQAVQQVGCLHGSCVVGLQGLLPVTYYP